MFKVLGIAVAALLLSTAICAPAAYADTIIDGTFDFTVPYGGPAPTGSFVFDSTTSVFTSFTIDWDGVVYDFTSPANIVGFATATQLGTWCAVAPEGSVCAPALPGSFSIPFDSLQPSSGTFTDPTAFAAGSFTFTETVTTTPEPGTIALMLLGVGMVFVMRKRVGRGLPRAA